MAEVKKFLDFTGLSRYHTNIKRYIDGNVGDISNLTTTEKSNVVVALNEVNALAKGATKALVVNSYSALISTLSSASKGDYLIGQNFYVKTADVPDVWISGINNNSTTYTYVSDSKVEEDLESNNLVVGYFQLSPLEGQKIDLSDYATTSDLSDLDDRKLDKDVEIVISAAINDLESRKLDKDTFTFIINITYSDLKNLRDNDQLVKGQQYRITDFVTTTTQENTQSAGHAFDIIVVADDINVLNENARAIKHSDDTYFADSKLEAWELKYCIDNDKTRFAWADDTNGKGVIYYMKDEFENECPYDFKNIMFERWWGNKIETTSQTATEDMTTAMKDMFVSHYHSYSSSDLTLGNSGLVIKIDSKNSKFFYTFSLCSDDGETFKSDDNETVYDGSLKHYGDNMYTNNVIKEYLPFDESDIIHKLNNIVFKPIDSSADDCGNNVFGKNCYDMTIGFSWTVNNSFGNECYDNSFGNGCGNNTFGNGCGNNTFGNDCGNNSFGNDCGNNSFGNGCNYNSFGNNCYNNSFGNGCGSNTFGNECNDNSFGNGCNYNSFGNDCYYNTFGNYCYNNSFGNGCNYNSFGNECYSNTFGNGCNYNTFGNGCYGNSFGNGCNHITFAKDYMYYNIVENGNQYITVTSTQTTSSSSVIRNFTIAQGVNNSSTLKTISHNTTNDMFKTTYQNSEFETVSV